MKYRTFIAILEEHGFTLKRSTGRHAQYEGSVGGVRKLVTVAYSRPGEDILEMNFHSMVRQSGLPKALFRDH